MQLGMDPSTIDEDADMRGPTPDSNWVIPGKLIAGAYPGDREGKDHHRDTIASVIDAGIIVCTHIQCEVYKCLPTLKGTWQYVRAKFRNVTDKNNRGTVLECN